jgi:hypothetical protein
MLPCFSTARDEVKCRKKKKKKKKKPYTSVSSLPQFTYMFGSQFRPTTQKHVEHIADKWGSRNPLA